MEREERAKLGSKAWEERLQATWWKVWVWCGLI